MSNFKQLAIRLGLMASLILVAGFILLALGLDKPVSFVNVLMLIGGLFGGFSIAAFMQYRKTKPKNALDASGEVR